LAGGLNTADGLSLATSQFRINRTPADGTSLEVHYTLNAYSGSDVLSQPGASVIPADADHVDISPDLVSQSESDASPEIVLLTLQDHEGYQLGQRSATLLTLADEDGYSEAALLGAYQDGQSAEAFRVLMDRYRAPVFRTCYRFLGNSHDAEDVLQMVFLALAQRQVRLQTTLAGWLRTVARNAAIVMLRARGRRNRHERQAAREDLSFGEEETRELGEELQAALDLVPPTLHEAVRLRYLDGLSQHDAAGVVGVPRGTLAQRAARGVQSLRVILSQRGTVAGVAPGLSAATRTG
jgi:RNA polymerase sigma-70 factor (ECF subfamily)